MFKKVYSTKINVISNAGASVWIALLNIIFVPLYLKYLGIEAYGIIGIFTSIQALINLLDFGLSPTINRELARLSVLPDSSQEMRDLKRTLELPNWIIAVSIALILAVLSPLIANYWVQPKNLSVSTVTQALIIIGVNIAVQFSANFYIGGLMGMQKQLLFNLINIFCASLRSLGAICILIFVSPTIQAFLLWQSAVALLQIILFAVTLSKSLPDAPSKGSFQKTLIQKIWRFAAGMTGISIVSLILTQLDKVILSRMISLETFGYYSLAITISSTAITIPVSAVTHTVYPQLSKLVLQDDKKQLSDYYHKSCQIISVLLFPTVMVLAFFSYQILLIWTKNEDIAANTHLILTLLAIGTGLNCAMWLPYYLQLAHGWTKLAFFMNVASIIFLIPIMILGICKYGVLGGAGMWVLLNTVYILITIQLMHRRILKGEQWRWYFKDVLNIAFINFFISGISYTLFPVEISYISTFLWLAITGLLCLIIPSLLISNTRNVIKSIIFRNDSL